MTARRRGAGHRANTVTRDRAGTPGPCSGQTVTVRWWPRRRPVTVAAGPGGRPGVACPGRSLPVLGAARASAAVPVGLSLND